MKRAEAEAGSGLSWTKRHGRFAVVLVRPESWENVGLAARGMANTGFTGLRLVGTGPIGAPAYRTAVHAESILDGARFFPDLAAATADRHLVFASTARPRRDFPLVPLPEAVRKVFQYPRTSRIGLVFGCERTGLTAEEIGLSNFRFRIPQAARQPSYNLGVAVTLALYSIAAFEASPGEAARGLPLTRAEQEEAGRRFKDLLESRGFMHETNREFITERVQDIFRRMVLDAKDRDIILAMFRKAVSGRSKKSTLKKEMK
jgi:TrmH family RNA methyltransferase